MVGEELILAEAGDQQVCLPLACGLLATANACAVDQLPHGLLNVSYN